MSAYVVVQFEQRLPTKSRGAIERLIARSGGVALGEQDAGTTGESGSMTISVPDMTGANELAAALRRIEGVDAAYAKPGEELP
jgi:hypothetical protein